MTTREHELLDILQTNGQNFLESFSLPRVASGSQKRRRTLGHTLESTSERARTPSDPGGDEEWGGITEYQTDAAEEPGNDSDSDGFMGKHSGNIVLQENVVIFKDFSSNVKYNDPVSKARLKAFMSSKASKLRQDTPQTPHSERMETEKEDDRSNMHNDALLHQLVHTRLLSGSLNPELGLTPAHRRKALAGRMLELSGRAKLGKGERSVREMERNKASKRVREGIIEKQKERGQRSLEEAKNLGNYHPTIKKLFDSTVSPSNKKRERGLKMGVGKFNGGLLRLSREDISIAEGKGRERGRSISSKRGRTK